VGLEQSWGRQLGGRLRGLRVVVDEWNAFAHRLVVLCRNRIVQYQPDGLL